MKRLYVSMCALLTLGSIALLQSCESASTDLAISVDPSSAILIEGEGSVVFTASTATTNQPLFLPLTWSVSDPSLGSISASGGFDAIYKGAKKRGNNAITVRDQAGAEGVASVNQPEQVEVPSGTNSVSTNTVTD